MFQFVRALSLAFLALLAGSQAWASSPDLSPAPSAGAPLDEVRVAVLAFRPKPETHARWLPLVDYLNREIPDRHFRLEVHTYPELGEVAGRGAVDFILTQPSHYILLTYLNGLSSPLATLVEKEGAHALANFGGVIFTRAGREDIDALEDVRGRRVATSSVTSLGSFQMQDLELSRAGVRLFKETTIVETGQPQDKAVRAVLEGKADVGFVRTGVIEAMAREGGLDPEQLKVINSRVVQGFPYRLSTHLYPEWPFAAMPRVDPDLARRVAAALLALPHDGALAREIGIEGFTIPGDYRPIDDLLRELRLPPFDAAPVFTLTDIWQRFQGVLAIGAGMGSLLLGGLVFGLYGVNRRLKREVAERQRAEGQLFKLSQAVEQSPNAIMITDLDARIEYVNEAFEAVTGFSAEEVVGKTPSILNGGRTPRGRFEDLWAHLRRGDFWQGEFINRRKDGSEYIEFARILPVRRADGSISNYLAIKEDVTERKRAEQRIQYLAHFDALTGLPNRTQLEDHLRYALTLARRGSGHLALMFLDLDHFKDINDTLGHSVGDALLVELSRRLRHVMREEDTVSRLGGDEFILLLPGDDARGAAHVADKILEVVSEPYRIEHYDLNVTASIGIALYPEDGQDLETLSKRADVAMYRAKRDGRSAYRFFTREMQEHSARNLQLGNALRFAQELGQLHLHYQPQVRLTDGRIVGVEALLRWQHPDLGAVSPAEFIPVAEDSGLILSIGEWVLRQAARQARVWQDAGHAPLVMAVNLSVVQFRHPDLPDLVTRILAEEGLPPEFLELELTESVAMHDPQQAINVMNKLHERGVRMSIDDFGIGYSSLSLLKQFRVYKLKIDRSFVRDISTDAGDKAIISAIVQMARSLGLLTIAEGVETSSQRNFLHEEGCDEVQGYFYSRPLPAPEVEALLSDGLPPGGGV
ncbi:MAG: EAL domain-containing protein [Pseudomonadota bacterium]